MQGHSGSLYATPHWLQVYDCRLATHSSGGQLQNGQHSAIRRGCGALDGVSRVLFFFLDISMPDEWDVILLFEIDILFLKINSYIYNITRNLKKTPKYVNIYNLK